MKRRTLLIFLIAGMLYYGFTQWTGIYIPCLFYKLTGWVCPGCGISHLCSDLISFRFDTAFLQNPGVSILICIWLVFAMIQLIRRRSLLNSRESRILMFCSVVFLLVFGVLRNINGFEWLLPYYMR